jgi:predicted alpha/beta-fold hydrolase
VLLLHGLEGSARSGYALETYRRLARRGIPAVGLNFRCSGPLNRGPRLYHSGETEDTRFVIRTLRARFPDARLGVVGFSFGGNVLVKYLGEEGERGQRGQGVAAVAAISVPYDLAAGARYMERGLAQLYVLRLLRSLQRKVRARSAALGDRMDVPRALRARTFHEFDDAATAPLHGFRDATRVTAFLAGRLLGAEVPVPGR